MADDDLGARLARFVGERLGAPVRVTHLERSTEGFSQETFVFDVEAGRERRGYVAKREPVAGLLEPYDLEPEFRVLHALSDDPLPSPPTPWFTRDPAVLERPFYVMERLPGEVPIPAARADGRSTTRSARRSAPRWPVRSRACTPSTGARAASSSWARPAPAARPPSTSSRAGRSASAEAGSPSLRRSPRRSSG